METEVIKISPLEPEPKLITKAVELIKNGELVAFPTETVYGLGANVLDVQALEKIFSAKRRPANNPIIVHIADLEDVPKYTKNVSPTARALMKRFWPGPLSLVLKKHEVIPDIATAGLDTVVLRCPSHPVVRKLIEEAGVPIAAPSANCSGLPSSTRAQQVLDDLKGLIPLILDGGPVEYGLESTVIDCTENTPVVLRPGSITEEMIAEVTELSVMNESGDKVRSPGLLHRHYAPRNPLTLTLSKQSLLSYLNRQSNLDEIAVVHHSQLSKLISENIIELSSDPKMAAPLLFDALRKLDKENVREIVVEGYNEIGIGKSLMERLKRGATKII